jgi:MYXO-CTERM domain-containing protein
MRRTLIVAALTLASLPLAAADAEASPIDGRVRMLFERRARNGDTLPIFRRSERFESTGMAPVVLRWKQTPSPAQLASYEALGLVVKRRIASGAWLADAREEALAAMQSDGLLGRVTVDLPPAIIAQPLQAAREELWVGAVAAAQRKATGGELDGTGIVIGDFDSEVDLYHPAFFRAGLPAAWTDVDGDGVLTPGVDGFDWSGDGLIEPTEVLWLLDGRASRLFGDESETHYGTDDASYNPSWDYLYLDLSLDGRRNAGPSLPDVDSLINLGEPMFVADDVNRDGVIAFPEKVVPLGESKFKAVLDGGESYVRGVNLGQYDPYALAGDPSHATSMLGASAGGQPGYSRWLGLAPNAELVTATREALFGPSLVGAMQWLADEGADVINTELGYWGLVPADGSSELELLIDALVQQGVVVVSPAGNLGSSGKHARAVIPANGGAPYTNEVVMQSIPNFIGLSVTWREGGEPITGSFSTADGDVVDLSVDEPSGNAASGRFYSVVQGTTSKGAGYLLMSMNGAPFPAGGNDLVLQSGSGSSLNAALFIIDDVSSWAGGSNFADFDVAGCMNPPALSVETLAISAYALNVGSDFAPYSEDMGELRAFSGRGPDLWGDPGIDIAAPDNPITARAESWSGGMPEGLYTRYTETGGTSGAGAIATGAVALIKQATGLEGAALRDAVLAAARGDDPQVVAGPVDHWGAGKLGLGLSLAPGGPPVVQGVDPITPPPDVENPLVAVVVDDADLTAARSRWDFNYDGIWDTEWIDGLAVPFVYPAGTASVVVKVEVMDADGWTAAGLVTLTEGAPLPEQKDGDGAAQEDDGCGCAVVGQRSPWRSEGWWLVAAGLGLVRRRWS